MHGVSRFLSRRDKQQEKRASTGSGHKSRPSQVSSDLYSIFTSQVSKKSADKELENKVKILLSRLQGAGISRMAEEQVLHALSWYPDDLDEAYNLLILANESIEGELKDYNPNVPMLGAVNRDMVTCYLDALLFAMFARLDSFEAMLYDNFEDEPRKKLAAVLRLWVNLLRTGQLIKVELTKHLQNSLAACGWEEAAQVCQQDASEAFTFITGALELPLLTLKMDIYHTGREDKEDDHKFVNERLLEVAIPDQQEDGHVVCLEDCLETYFNNRIEVKRFLQRQNTIASVKSKEDGIHGKDPEKSTAMQVETIELAESLASIVATPTSFRPSAPPIFTQPTFEGRQCTESIFSQRLASKSPEAGEFDEKRHLEDVLDHSSGGRPRSASLLRKEILMPAWQFFSLIPWYTDNVPQTDAQVAAHFSVKRPVLGICLKRYTVLPDGTSKRLDTYIDIPLEIGLPHFISDDRMRTEGPLFGNFKLVLQSVVCHRGVSVDSGHYIALVRANCHERPVASQINDEESPQAWLRFDDLSSQRVAPINIRTALREESPYLLFYQVQPIDEELASRGDPPPYTEAHSRLSSPEPSRETFIFSTSAPISSSVSASVSTTSPDIASNVDQMTPSESNYEPSHLEEELARHSFSSNHRSSMAIEDFEETVSSLPPGRTQPPTPEDQKPGFLSASRRGSRAWTAGVHKSRPNSPANESRLSLTLSKLKGRASKDQLQSMDTAAGDPTIVIEKIETRERENHGPTVISEKHDTGVSRSKSKKVKKDKHRRTKSRELNLGVDKDKNKSRNKDRPERECTVM